MSRAKVIVKQQGMIDTKSFGTKRKIDIDRNELDVWCSDIKGRQPPTTAEESLIDDSDIPYVGEQGELIWESKNKQPEYIKDICNVVRSMFSLGKEVKSFSVRIFKPPTKINHKHIVKVEKVPYELAMVIGSRIIITVGSDEMIDLFASSGQKGQPSGGGQIKLNDGYGLMTPIGLAAGVDFSWHNGSMSEGEAPRKGFRPVKVKKNPLNRYMIVVDCINDENVLMDAIKGQAKSATGGNQKNADMLASQMAKVMNISDVDAVAAAAAGKSYVLEQHDSEVPNLVDLVAQKQSGEILGPPSKAEVLYLD